MKKKHFNIYDEKGLLQAKKVFDKLSFAKEYLLERTVNELEKSEYNVKLSKSIVPIVFLSIVLSVFILFSAYKEYTTTFESLISVFYAGFIVLPLVFTPIWIHNNSKSVGKLWIDYSNWYDNKNSHTSQLDEIFRKNRRG